MEDRLYKFARLVEAHSFTKAAAELHISQPALTTAIKKLERELHAELLVRGSHTFELTNAGHMAYQAAKELSVHVHNLTLRLREAAREKVALNLGMIDSVADLLFVHGDHLTELEHDAELSLTVNNSAQLIRQVAHDELDVALIAEPARLPGTLTAALLAEEPLVLVTAKTNEAKVLRELRTKQIHHFLGYNRNSQTHQLVARHFSQKEITLYTTFYSTSPEIMRRLVLAGRGSAVLPYLLVKEDLAAGRLSAVAFKNGIGSVLRRIVSLHRTGRAVPQSASGLLERARSELSQLQKEVKTISL
ncbi:MAG TPA: LysR family transcriptional regulator [Candidatus Saccharimonadales bacterium]|nr:LysR family transcriptional regulator [Candidatus Saccharimonadales bacterium]